MARHFQRQLLALAASSGFAALITMDSGIQYQQNLAALPCSVLIITAQSNALEHIEPLIPSILNALSNLPRAAIVRVQ